ncbi:MAG TPA: hypothetical protein PKD45_04035 [Flavobacteriales bacterium]|nr:hypothetical protein [Flavobacteriales bacterium]
MKVSLRFLLLAAAIVAPFAGALMAQPGPGGGPPCWPPPCIPIDGGISLLIGAGALLGGKKAMDLRKARKSEV